VAFSMIVMTGRLGAIFGIIVVGILIDKSCLMTFYLLALLVLSKYNNLNIMELCNFNFVGGFVSVFNLFTKYILIKKFRNNKNEVEI